MDMSFVLLQEIVFPSLAPCMAWVAGGSDAGKVLVRQDEGMESPPLLDPSGLLAKEKGRQM